LSPAALLSEAATHRLAIEKTAPPSLLVDAGHRLVHLSEHAGRYLQPSGGPLSGDVVDLVRPEFRFELRSALNRAFEHGQSTLSLAILVRFNGAPHPVHIQVRPAVGDDEAEPHRAVVLFIEGEAVEPSTVTLDQRHANDEIVRRLSEDLQLAQTRLRTTREESDSANEELRAANEELQSINEEYRSTSEELETSKEELQSINEELQTVNSELKLKLDAVSQAHNDLQNLIAATDFGTLFLDADLCIKWFTPRITDLFRITARDEGRPVTDFAHQLEYDGLVKDAQAVLAQLAPVKRELRSQDGRWYDVRTRPYRTADDKIDGVVITFVDMTERLEAELALRESEQRLRQEKRLVELSRDPIFIWDFDDGIVAWNRGSEELYGYVRDEALGKKKEQLLATDVPGSSFDDLRASLLASGSWSGELTHRTKAGRQLTVESRIVLETIEGRRLALETIRDVTERKQSERRLHLLLGEMSHRVKNTLAVVQAIAHQTQRHTRSNADFVQRFDGRLMALSRAHNLLVDSDWTGADLGALARSQLAPYVSDNPDRLHIDGAAVSLPADIATPFGLVLHELATNAAKFGSLSRKRGTVSLSWTCETQNHQPVLTVAWQEKGGPPVKRPSKPGFGSSLIEHGIPHATARREFRSTGLICTITLPLSENAQNGTAGQG
jgi:two-component system CheB/CheR fusion protein